MTPDVRLDPPLHVINIGLDVFARELEAQGVSVVRVEWRPPAGSPDVAALLATLDDETATDP